MRVTLTPSAERDLDDIEAYIAADNPAAAIDTVLRVLDSLAHLSEQTELGRTGRIPGTREWIIPDTRSSPRIDSATMPFTSCVSCMARESGRGGFESD